MIGMLFSNILHAKIIYHEGEGDRTPFGRIVSDFVRTRTTQDCDGPDKACVRQTVHPAPDLDINVSFAVDFVFQFVFLGDFVGECVDF